MDVLSVGIWNVRTLCAAGKLELLKIEMGRYRCDVLGIVDVRSGEMKSGPVQEIEHYCRECKSKE